MLPLAGLGDSQAPKDVVSNLLHGCNPPLPGVGSDVRTVWMSSSV